MEGYFRKGKEFELSQVHDLCENLTCNALYISQLKMREGSVETKFFCLYIISFFILLLFFLCAYAWNRLLIVRNRVVNSSRF